MAWAPTTMALVRAWRKISSRRTTGTAPESMRSASTAPGPTEGSWSRSPTSTSRPSVGRASSRAWNSSMSTIEVSSTMTASPSSREPAFRLNPPAVNSRSRWMVFASLPVASASRFAARPVGAHSSTRRCRRPSASTMARTSVVLPVPGPPVITSNRLVHAASTASRWRVESVMPVMGSAPSVTARAPSSVTAAAARRATIAAAACSGPARRGSAASGRPSTTSSAIAPREARVSTAATHLASAAPVSFAQAPARRSRACQRCPSSAAAASACRTAASSRAGASSLTPSFRAMASAVGNAIPATSSAST